MSEKINHPSHYQGKNNIEVINVIEAFNLNFNTGNAVKYILRNGKKTEDTIIDIKKAIWYLNRELDNKKITNCKLKEGRNDKKGFN